MDQNSSLSSEIQERFRKLKELKEAKINPYLDSFQRTHKCEEALELAKNSKLRDSMEIDQNGANGDIKVCGRLKSFRGHGKLTFGQLQDFSGMIQICFSENALGKDKYKFLKKLDIGDFIGIDGELFQTHKGEFTVFIKDYFILSKSLRPLPEKWHGLKDQEALYRQRYLDLAMNRNTMERFIFRSDLVKTLREFYWQEGFMEIEPPVLENISSGATAKPFITHHNALDIDVYLRIAAGELWQKMAIGGGMEKTFEVARCFRNEGIDPSHLQEFTMIEHYAAYWNFEENMRFTERMFEYFLKKLFGSTKLNIKDREGKEVEVDFKAPWPRKEFVKLIEENCGIDVLKTTDPKKLLDEIKKKNIQIEDSENLGYGGLIDALYKKVVRPKLIQPCFVIKHPADMKPLARKNDENEMICDTFQLLVNTWEIINAYSEIVDPVDQRKRFEVQALAKAGGDEEAMMMNEEYLLAMEHGFPPISGWGMGIDRLVALLTEQDNLKDVVLFPLLRPLENAKKNMVTNVKKTSNAKSVFDAGITIEQAKDLLNKYAKTDVFKLHCRETEVIMRALAKHFGENEEVWGIAGLLHDLDWEIEGVKEDPSKHGILSAEILKENNVNEEIIKAIQAHNCEYNGTESRKSRLDFALSAAETITGLIYATALIYPNKKLASVNTESVLKRMKKKDFARNCDRNRIQECEKIGLSLEEFSEISLQAMKEIASEIGL